VEDIDPINWVDRHETPGDEWRKATILMRDFENQVRHPVPPGNGRMET
jgi:hypothetical protein